MQGLLDEHVADSVADDAPPTISAAPDRAPLPGRRLSLRRRVLFPALAMCASLFAAIAAAEIGLRIAGYGRSYTNPMGSFFVLDGETGYHGKPNFTGRFRRAEFDVTVEHDKNGFRRGEEAGAADSREVYVLGDSFIWGYGIGQRELAYKPNGATAGPPRPQFRPDRRGHGPGVADFPKARRRAPAAGRYGRARLLRQRFWRQCRQASCGPRLRHDRRRTDTARPAAATVHYATVEELAERLVMPLQSCGLLRRSPPG